MMTPDCCHIVCSECLSHSKDSCPVCGCRIGKYKSTCLVNYKKMEDSKLKLRGLMANYNKYQFRVPTASFLNRVIVFTKTQKIDSKGETSLHVACRRGDLFKVQWLICKGVDINYQDYTGWTPLHEAVCHNHTNIVKKLLKSGALVDVPGENFATPLHTAVQKNNFEIATELLKFGAFPHVTDYFGLSPIDYAQPHLRENVFKNNFEKRYSIDRKLFAHLPLNVYCDRIDVDLITHPKLNLVKFNNLKKGDVNVVVLGCPDDVTHSDVILFALMQGSLIVTKNWLDTFVEDRKIYSNEIYINGANTKKSVLYNIYKKPKLFAGIKFYFMDKTNAAYTIGRTTIQELVLMGGGKILQRTQTLGTAKDDVGYPYHVKSDALVQCCNYIIYPEDAPPLSYRTKELQTRSLRWLLNCILNYSIRENFTFGKTKFSLFS